MDPAESASTYAARAVLLSYETLLEYDYSARPYRLIPGLSESWPSIQSNGLVYVFKIHPRARFHSDACFGKDADGRNQERSVTAEDVVFSLKRLADRKVSSPGAWLVEDTLLGMRSFAERSAQPSPTDYAFDVPGLMAVDAWTVRIELTRPLHIFPYLLTIAYSAIVPREAVLFYGKEFGSHEVGTGPYRLADWRRNHQMVFSREPSWRGWNEGPAAIQGDLFFPFDRIVYRLIDDVSTQWLCFLAGELDFLGEVTRDNWDVVIDASGALSDSLRGKGFTLYSLPTLEVAYIGINMEDPVLGSNRPLRQALNCAFDGAAWEQFYNGRVIRCDGPVPPGAAGRQEAAFPYAHNLDLARRLLREAGYPDGKDSKTGRRLELTLDLGRTSQDMRETTELIVSFWAQVGIALKPQFHSWPTFLKRVASRQSQLFRLGWSADYPDAENFMKLFYSQNASPGPNRSNYVNPVFDRLYEEACAATHGDERNRSWSKAQELVREDCPWVFLHFQKAYSLCNSRVLNYRPSDFPSGSEKYLRTPKMSAED
jgi:ABC-type transport system substrate-binding protein